MAPGDLRRSALLPALCLAALLFSCAAADWPGWRGPARDGHTTETLPEFLPTQPPPRWRTPLGHGYASPVVAGGVVVVLAAIAGQETAVALDAATGRERWRTPFAKAWADEFEPGPRCTPLIDGDLVFVQSAQGEFACLDRADGRKRWSFNFADYGTVWIPDVHSNTGAAVRRGHTGSPVVAGDRVVVQVGSTQGAAFAAFDRRTGRLLWKSLNDQASYSSPVLGTLAGRTQLVSATCEGLVGVDPRDGSALWRVPFRTGANRNVLTPLLSGDSVVFASHTTGLRHVTVRQENNRQVAVEDWLNRDLKLNLATPVLSDGHLYGLGPARNFICVDAGNGQVKWTQPGFGEVASVISGSGRLIVQLDSGEVRLLRATPARYEELGRFQACGKTFSHPAWSDGILFVRDPNGCSAYSLVLTTP